MALPELDKPPAPQHAHCGAGLAPLPCTHSPPGHARCGVPHQQDGLPCSFLSITVSWLPLRMSQGTGDHESLQAAPVAQSDPLSHRQAAGCSCNPHHGAWVHAQRTKAFAEDSKDSQQEEEMYMQEKSSSPDQGCFPG